MLWFLLFSGPMQTVQLGPPQPVIGQVVLRYQPGLAKLPKTLAVLKTCTQKSGLKLPHSQPLEIRVVDAAWLNRAFPRPPKLDRLGRYYVAKNGHPALIYVAQTDDAMVTVAHEWLHHLATVYGYNWTEKAIETRAKSCALTKP